MVARAGIEPTTCRLWACRADRCSIAHKLDAPNLFHCSGPHDAGGCTGTPGIRWRGSVAKPSPGSVCVRPRGGFQRSWASFRSHLRATWSRATVFRPSILFRPRMIACLRHCIGTSIGCRRMGGGQAISFGANRNFIWWSRRVLPPRPNELLSRSSTPQR